MYCFTHHFPPGAPPPAGGKSTTGAPFGSPERSQHPHVRVTHPNPATSGRSGSGRQARRVWVGLRPLLSGAPDRAENNRRRIRPRSPGCGFQEIAAALPNGFHARGHHRSRSALRHVFGIGSVGARPPKPHRGEGDSRKVATMREHRAQGFGGVCPDRAPDLESGTLQKRRTITPTKPLKGESTCT